MSEPIIVELRLPDGTVYRWENIREGEAGPLYNALDAMLGPPPTSAAKSQKPERMLETDQGWMTESEVETASQPQPESSAQPSASHSPLQIPITNPIVTKALISSLKAELERVTAEREAAHKNCTELAHIIERVTAERDDAVRLREAERAAKLVWAKSARDIAIERDALLTAARKGREYIAYAHKMRGNEDTRADLDQADVAIAAVRQPIEFRQRGGK